MMDLVLRNVTNTEEVRIALGDLVGIKGACFKVVGMSLADREIKLQPANSDQIKEFLGRASIKAPKLSEPAKEKPGNVFTGTIPESQLEEADEVKDIDD